MMKPSPGTSITALLGFIAVFFQASHTVAAELKVMTPRSMWTVLKEIGPEFERNSGHKLDVVTGIAATLADRIILGRTSTFSLGRLFRSNGLSRATNSLRRRVRPSHDPELAWKCVQARPSLTSIL